MDPKKQSDKVKREEILTIKTDVQIIIKKENYCAECSCGPCKNCHPLCRSPNTNP